MEKSILALLLAALPAVVRGVGDFMKDPANAKMIGNALKDKDAVKSTVDGAVKGVKEFADDVAHDDLAGYRKIGWEKDPDNPKALRQTYALPPGKTLEGMAGALERYFKSIDGTTVTATPRGRDAYDLKCETASIWRKKLGLDVKILLTLTARDEGVEVRFLQNVDDHVFKNLAIDSAPAGLAGLYGAMLRSEIPNDIHSELQSYLTGSTEAQ